jgi:hypothetical protein
MVLPLAAITPLNAGAHAAGPAGRMLPEEVGR